MAETACSGPKPMGQQDPDNAQNQQTDGDRAAWAGVTDLQRPKLPTNGTSGMRSGQTVGRDSNNASAPESTAANTAHEPTMLLMPSPP